MENITASELAGFGVGTLLLCATIAAPRVDSFISASQRSALGMCKRCGNLRMIACKKCKGAGLIREGSPFGLTLLDDSKLRSSSCTNCQGRASSLNGVQVSNMPFYPYSVEQRNCTQGLQGKVGGQDKKVKIVRTKKKRQVC